MSLTHKKNALSFISFLCLLVFFITFSACMGGSVCGPSVNALLDADSDCFEDTDDNCPYDYNPDQIDMDEDEVGVLCDQNDDDSTIGPANLMIDTTTLPSAIEERNTLHKMLKKR